MTRVLLAMALFGVALGAVTPAQVRVIRHGDDRLAGIREVDVLVDIGGEAAGPCAVDRAAVGELAQSALREAGIQATISRKARSWFYSVVISGATTTVGRPPSNRTTDGSCAAFVETELVAEVEGFPEVDRHASGKWGSILIGHLPLFSKTDLVTGPAEAHDAAVRQAVRAGVTALATKLRAANP